jgi:hypothetical protein
MSKNSRAKSKQERLKKKRAKKAATKARYQKYAEAGRNKKSKRFKSKKRKTISKKDHPNGRCGNPGCIRCFGLRAERFLVDGVPRGMPHKIWLKWKEMT